MLVVPPQSEAQCYAVEKVLDCCVTVSQIRAASVTLVYQALSVPGRCLGGAVHMRLLCTTGLANFSLDEPAETLAHEKCPVTRKTLT